MLGISEHAEDAPAAAAAGTTTTTGTAGAREADERCLSQLHRVSCFVSPDGGAHKSVEAA
jgi:hypothetical protein|eukprot:COSAG01_NODE_3669_length_5811_cov_6.420868_4_plen_60_part_00